jgi:hypothetical protein
MTEQWDFVIAAYVLTAALTAAVLWGSRRAMQAAERRADALRQERT